MNKKFMFVFVGIFLMTLIGAAWALTIEGSTTAYVTGSPNTLISLTIPTININTTEGNDSMIVYSDNFVIYKDLNFNVSINETFTDTSNGSCTGGETDCSLVYMIKVNSSTYVPIYDGLPVNLEGSPLDKNISIEMTCEAYSCPQERSIDIILSEI